MIPQQQATDLQSLRSIAYAFLIFCAVFAAYIFGAFISSMNFKKEQELQANATLIKQEEESWSLDFTLLNVKVKKGGNDE